MGANEDRDAEDALLCTCNWGANPNCRLQGVTAQPHKWKQMYIEEVV